ncbi:hypothetical protein XENORESO_003206 [Xenotaenia resolanae]|uniref:Uncharacterized protein n=1 Tax=Xenotaenia resolanae TaxID=208358 RepID=A0ABV0WSF4_9TELE
MMNIRPSSSTGVLLALVYNNTVPLSVAVVTKGEEDAVGFLIPINTLMFTSDQTFVTLFAFALQNLQVFLDGVSVATLDSLMLCYPDRLMVQLNVTPTEIQISANSSTVSYIKSDALQKALEHLNTTMQNPIGTYIGGIPVAVPLHATPVSAFYHGCLDIAINDRQLDFDEALSKHNSIKSHSCPPVRDPEHPRPA